MKTLTSLKRVGRVGQRRQVVIPRDILEGLNLQAGDLVSFAEHKNGVLIRPKRARKPPPDADCILTPAEEKIVRRGEAAFKRGESKSWRDVKNALSLRIFRTSAKAASQAPSRRSRTDCPGG